MRSVFVKESINPSLKQRLEWLHDWVTKVYCDLYSYEVDKWFLDLVPELIDIVNRKMEGTVMYRFTEQYLNNNYDTCHLTFEQYKLNTKEDE